MKLNKQTNNKKKIILLLVLAVVAVTGVYFGAAAFYKLPPFASEQKTYEIGEQTVNYDRTETEKKAEEVIRDNPEQKTQNPQTDRPKSPESEPDGKAKVNVLITNVSVANGTLSASGMVTNLVQEGGDCRYIFTNGAQTITKISSPLTTPTSTACATVRFPAAELAGDGWSVKLTYESDTATGVSEVREFNK